MLQQLPAVVMGPCVRRDDELANVNLASRMVPILRAALPHTLAADVEYWPTPDPTTTEGSREQKLTAYLDVCDGLMMRIRRRFSKVGAASG